MNLYKCQILLKSMDNRLNYRPKLTSYYGELENQLKILENNLTYRNSAEP